MKIETLRSFDKDWRKVKDQNVRDRISVAIHSAANQEPGVDVKPLIGHPGWFRLRVGDYRVLFGIHEDNETEIMILTRLIPRGELERAVKQL